MAVKKFRNQAELDEFLKAAGESFVKGATKQVAEEWKKIVTKKLYNHRPVSDYYSRMGEDGGFLSSITEKNDASFNGKKWSASVGFDASKLKTRAPNTKARPPQFGAHTNIQGGKKASNMFLWQEFGYSTFSRKYKQGYKRIRAINTLPVIRAYVERLMRSGGNPASTWKYWDMAFIFSKK